MTRFNAKIGAGVLVGLGLVYMVVSLATGREALAEPPEDLAVDPGELGVGVWQLADLTLREGEAVPLVDVRGPRSYARYHVPGATSEAGAGPGRLAELARSSKVVVVHSSDGAAGQLVAATRAASGSKNVFYLKGGARSWYLALALPVPLFSEKDAPHGYEEALATVRAHFAGKGGGDRSEVKQAIDTLVRLEYAPTLLGSKKKKPAKKRKKIAGGCG